MVNRYGLVAVVVSAALMSAAAPGLAQPNEEPLGTDEQMVDITAAQAAERMGMTLSEYGRHSRALETIDTIEALVGDKAGYLGSEVDYQKGRVVVSWDKKSLLPPGLTSVGVGGITVEAKTAAPSPELEEWLTGQGRPNKVADVQGITYDRDAAGFVVDVVEGSATAGQSSDELRKALGLPAPIVTINKYPRDRGGLLSRWEDEGAHNPGSRAINGPFNAPCTAAFKVRKNGGGEALLTAAHCHSGGFYNAGNWMGSVSDSSYRTFNTDRDISLIEGDSDGYGVSMYTGWYNSSSLVRVTSPATPSFGLSVCAGGAMSGEVCSGIINANNGTRYGRTPVFTAQFGGSTGGAGNMDSGGPIYTYYSSSTGTYVRPVGLISSGDVMAPCAGQPESPERRCFQSVHGAQITTAQSAMGYDILSSSD